MVRPLPEGGLYDRDRSLGANSPTTGSSSSCAVCHPPIEDGHAAHERIVYEKLKRERDGGAIERQALLSPRVVDLDPDAAALVEAHAPELATLGLMSRASAPARSWYAKRPRRSRPGDLIGLVRDLAADLAADEGAQAWRGGSIVGSGHSPAAIRFARGGH